MDLIINNLPNLTYSWKSFGSFEYIFFNFCINTASFLVVPGIIQRLNIFQYVWRNEWRRIDSRNFRTLTIILRTKNHFWGENFAMNPQLWTNWLLFLEKQFDFSLCKQIKFKYFAYFVIFALTKLNGNWTNPFNISAVID